MLMRKNKDNWNSGINKFKFTVPRRNQKKIKNLNFLNNTNHLQNFIIKNQNSKNNLNNKKRK